MTKNTATAAAEKAAPSIKQLMLTKVLKRADAHKARLADIHEEPGFNWRLEGADLDQSIEELAAFLAAGGQVPDVEVRPRADGGLWIVEGHRRVRALRLLTERGQAIPGFTDKDGEVWVPVKPFTGDEAQRAARVMTSQEGRPLTPLEIALGYQRMQQSLGLGPEAIAKLVHKTRQHVDQMLILAAAPQGVHDLVAAGAVSATTAVQVTRKEGENATEVLAKAAEEAKGKGKAKVTGREMKPWTPPAKRVPDLVAALDDVEKTLPAKTRMAMLEMERNGNLRQNTVAINAGALWELLRLQDELNQLREKRAELDAAASEAAKQTEITE